VEARGRYSKRRKIAIIFLICLLIGLIIFYVVEGLYIEGLPTGRFYHYSYHVEIGDVSSGYVLTLPIPVLEDGSIIPHIDFENIEQADAKIVQTAHGPGLLIAGDGNLVINLKGEYDARTNSPDHEYDGTPVLSMCSLNHSYEIWNETSGQVWLESDTEGVSILIIFESWWKDWKIRSGIFHNGYVRGGDGYGQIIEKYLSEGWNQCPVDIVDIQVE